MRDYKKHLEIIANDYLEQNAEATGDENKPNYSNRDFMNIVIIFQNGLMDKMFNNMNFDKMPMDERMKMAEKSGKDLHKFIFTYTGLDITKIEDFL